MNAHRSGPPPDRARLLTLLHLRGEDVGGFSFATPETLAVARALGPDVAAEVVSRLLAAYSPGGDHVLVGRAAHVAHELRLAGAIPALVACLERLPHGDRIAKLACSTLELIGRPAIQPLIDALARAPTADVRFAVGLALTLMPADDGRVRAAFESVLAVDPETAAQLLGAHGDRSALPALEATLDRLALPPPGAGELGRLEALVSVGEAIAALRGKLTPARRAKLDRATSRMEELILRDEDPDELP